MTGSDDMTSLEEYFRGRSTDIFPELLKKLSGFEFVCFTDMYADSRQYEQERKILRTWEFAHY
jgi:hypothetical protein